jgi:hypothetical protein
MYLRLLVVASKSRCSSKAIVFYLLAHVRYLVLTSTQVPCTVSHIPRRCKFWHPASAAVCCGSFKFFQQRVSCQNENAEAAAPLASCSRTSFVSTSLSAIFWSGKWRCGRSIRCSVFGSTWKHQDPVCAHSNAHAHAFEQWRGNGRGGA